jgi:hypothetical protein
MTEIGPARPPLATIICIYLIVTAFIPLQVMWILIWGWFHSIYNYPPILLHSPMSWLMWTLAIAGAITLWQMRRVAFFLLAIRYTLSLALLVIDIPPRIAFFHRMSAILPRSVADSAMRASVASIAAQWLLSAAIIWYVYRITPPQHVSPELADPELTT